MFRIDVYQPKEEKPSQPPLYACLSTAVSQNNNNNNGQLLTAGRKNATVLFESDKSVSRDHLHLHLMSNHKEHQEALVLNGEDETVAAGAMVPQSPEEKDACRQDHRRGMALLVKNLGKFGSAVLALEPMAAEDDKKGNNNNKNAESKKASAGSDDDSETDAGGGSDTEDESQEKAAPYAGGLPTVPGVTWFEQTKKIVQSLVSNNDVKMTSKKLDANETFAVPGNASTIFIQCGQVASLLVLTRLDLNFCKSSLSTGDTSLWRNRLYAVGGILMDKNVDSFMVEHSEESNASKEDRQQKSQDQDDDPPTTYMLTKTEREASSKQIVAWLLDIPFITTSFLEALFQRKAPSDPWPEASRYAPSNGSHSFWDTDCPNKSRLLESCTYLCTSNKQTDMECLVKAAGGHVISLYEMKEDDAQNLVQELMEDPDKKDALFTISASGRNKLAKYIKGQGIAQLSPKEITTCVCNQEMPKDKETGRSIGKPPAANEDSKPAGKAGEEETVHRSENTGKSSRSDKPGRDSATEKVPEPETRSKSDEPTKRKRDPEPVVTNEEEPAGPAQTTNKKPRKGKSDSQAQRAHDALPPVQEEDENLNNTTAESMEVEPEEVEKPSKKRSRQEESSESKKIIKTSYPPRVQSAGSGTARLETTDDGWLVAAPKDELRRQAYLKPLDEMLESCSQEKPPEVAPTVACKGLVCRRYDPNRNSITGVRRKSSGGKDFKKFRKNPIKQVSRGSRIQLRSVLPKETVRQRQLEEQQRELEAQQRKADELFQNEPRRSTKPSATRKRRNV